MRQAAAGTVDFQRALAGTVADDGFMLAVLCHADAEPAVALLPGGANGDGHVEHAPLDAGEVDLPADRDIAVYHALPARAFQLPYRVLIKPAVPDRQLTGNGRLPEPAAVIRLCAHRAPVLHPGNHNPPPVGSQEGLRRVEIKAVVNRLHKLP